MSGSRMLGIGAHGAALSPLKAPAQVDAKGKTDPEEIKKAARAFEAYFISSLLKEMRKTVPSETFLGSGPGKEIYEGLLDETFAAKMSEQGGIGLAKLLVKKLADQASSFKEMDR